MNQFRVENYSTDTYLVYQMSENEEVDSFSRGMLANNAISGVAPVLFTQQDADRFMKYDITGKISLKQYFSTPVSKNKLLSVFSSVVDSILAADEFSLDISQFILDSNFIFIDEKTKEAMIIFLPIENLSVDNSDLLTFFKAIMYYTQFDKTENHDYITTIVTYLNNNLDFSLTDFKNVIDNLKNNITVSAKAQHNDELTSDSVSITVFTEKEKKITTKKEPAVVSDDPGTTKTNIRKPDSKKAIVQKPATQTSPADPDEEKISLFFLLQHYNEENAAKYKAQKESAKTKSTNTVPTEQNDEAIEDPISLFYLLQHYNKENAAKYKAQKDAAKGKKGSVAKTSAPSKNNKSAKASKEKVNFGYAVPGKSVQETMPEIVPSSSADEKAPYAPPPINTPVQHTQESDFGDTIVLQYSSTISETEAVDSGNKQKTAPIPYLIRKKTNEKILISSPNFRIGTDADNIEYRIADNNAISHKHASIINSDIGYYIIDEGSTNHTFVNGKVILKGKKILLQNGDAIRLANEKFDFFVY